MIIGTDIDGVISDSPGASRRDTQRRLGVNCPVLYNTTKDTDILQAMIGAKL